MILDPDRSLSHALTQFMVKRYARAVSMELGDWLEQNPPPSICEPKYDGFRVFIFKSGEKLLLTTRHGVIYSQGSHPQLFKKIAPLRKGTGVPEKVVLDGEYIAPDGLSIFDVIRIGEDEVTEKPLIERKKILASILSGGREFLSVKYEFAGSYQEIMKYKSKLIADGAEGVVIKNPGSRYGQKNSWLKLKKFDTVDCFVTGIDRTIEMDRTGIPHSWFIGLYDDRGQVMEMGKVGTYLKEVDPSRIKVGTVIEIRFQEVTVDLKFRGPLIIRVREDKKKEDCTFSQIPAISRKQPPLK